MDSRGLRDAGIFVGLLLVAVGAFLLLGAMDLLGDITRYWPVALIALGVAQIFGRPRAFARPRSENEENRYGSASY
jgi:cell wall-active antibiotic response 4TMS protein YvqF